MIEERNFNLILHHSAPPSFYPRIFNECMFMYGAVLPTPLKYPTAVLLFLRPAFEYGGRLHFVSQHVKIDDGSSPERNP